MGNLRWREPQPAPIGMECGKPISSDPFVNNLRFAARVPGRNRPTRARIAFSSTFGPRPIGWRSAACDGVDSPRRLSNRLGTTPGLRRGGLAKKGVVLVTINYRLGVFGFFSHPALTKESEHHASGNYALMDQVAALAGGKILRRFGGDPHA